MDRICRTCGQVKNVRNILFGKLKERDSLEDLGVD
jgi:hypothetical protein